MVRNSWTMELETVIVEPRALVVYITNLLRQGKYDIGESIRNIWQ